MHQSTAQQDITQTVGIGTKLYGDSSIAMAMGQEQADANGAPVGIWSRDGWYTVCEDPEPIENGWTMIAILEGGR